MDEQTPNISLEGITYWETEGERIEKETLDKILFKENNSVKEFLNTGRNFIIATKGIGKTILLKAKRDSMAEQYETKRSDSSETSKVIFLPQDRPYLDLADSFGNLDKNKIKYLSNWVNCEKIWSVSLQVSILNSYSRSIKNNTLDFSVLDAKSKQVVKDTEAYTPVQTAQYIINMGVSEIEQLYNNGRLNINRMFITDIQSAILVFIDRIDQALEEYHSREIWISMQAGLLEAAWNVMRNNHHVKIFTSIRLEAFSNYESSNKMAIDGSVTILEYEKDDLLKMMDKMSMGYLNMPFYENLGLETFQHPEQWYKQDTFDYILNHTISRPREIVVLLSHYHKPSTEDKNEIIRYLRESINETATQKICPDIFSEYELFMNCLNDKKLRENFFALLNKNILTYTEAKEICSKYNAKSDCDEKNCKKCEEMHPFCDLYNIGLLGIVEKEDGESTKYKQKFLSPNNLKAIPGNYLPPTSNCYLLHPSLNKLIKDTRDQGNRGEYAHILFIHIGDGNDWHDWYDEWIELNKLLDDAVHENIIKKIEKEMVEIIKSNTTEKISLLEKFRAAMDQTITIGGKIINTTETILKLVDILPRMLETLK
jgi:hypothetical protein